MKIRHFGLLGLVIATSLAGTAVSSAKYKANWFSGGNWNDFKRSGGVWNEQGVSTNYNSGYEGSYNGGWLWLRARADGRTNARGGHFVTKFSLRDATIETRSRNSSGNSWDAWSAFWFLFDRGGNNYLEIDVVEQTPGHGEFNHYTTKGQYPNWQKWKGAPKWWRDGWNNHKGKWTPNSSTLWFNGQWKHQHKNRAWRGNKNGQVRLQNRPWPPSMKRANNPIRGNVAEYQVDWVKFWYP